MSGAARHLQPGPFQADLTLESVQAEKVKEINLLEENTLFKIKSYVHYHWRAFCSVCFCFWQRHVQFCPRLAAVGRQDWTTGCHPGHPQSAYPLQAAQLVLCPVFLLLSVWGKVQLFVIPVHVGGCLWAPSRSRHWWTLNEHHSSPSWHSWQRWPASNALPHSVQVATTPKPCSPRQ